MFPTRRTSKILQRASGALVLLRSFLMLEDDSDVDWEVGRETAQLDEHPHRAALRGPLRLLDGARRPGQPASARQVCLTPHLSPSAHGHGGLTRERDAQPRRTRGRTSAHGPAR